MFKQKLILYSVNFWLKPSVNSFFFRFEDLDTYLQQLKHYLKSSSALSTWINDTHSHIDAQLTARTDDLTVLSKLLNQQKVWLYLFKKKKVVDETTSYCTKK